MKLALQQRSLILPNFMGPLSIGIFACYFSLEVANARTIIIYNSLHHGDSAPARTWAIATSVVAFAAEITTLGILWLIGARFLTVRTTSRHLGKDGECVEEEEEEEEASIVQPLSARAQKVLWIIFSSFLLCAPLFLAIYYPIFAVQSLSPWFFQQYAQDPHKFAGLSGTVGLMSNLADISVVGTFMALIYQHHHLIFQSFLITAWKTFLDTTLGIGIVGLTLAEVAFSFRVSTTDTLESIHHAFVAIYCVFIMNIFLSAFHLSKKLRESGIDDTLISPLYFSRVTLLMLEAVFRVVSDILISLPSQDVNIGVLRLVDTLIKAIVYSVALFVLAYSFNDFI